MNLIASFRQYGWSVFPRILKNLLRRVGIVVESYYLLTYNIDKQFLEKKMQKYDYTNVKPFYEKDLKLLTVFDNSKIELLKNRLSTDEYSGFAIWQGNKIVYITWISWNLMNYPTLFNLQSQLKSNEALLEDSYCHPDFRGKGFHSMMNLYRINEISKMNKTTVLALVLKENKPALKVQIKSGFILKERISLLKIGTWTKIKKKPCYD